MCIPRWCAPRRRSTRTITSKTCVHGVFGSDGHLAFTHARNQSGSEQHTEARRQADHARRARQAPATCGARRRSRMRDSGARCSTRWSAGKSGCLARGTIVMMTASASLWPRPPSAGAATHTHPGVRALLVPTGSATCPQTGACLRGAPDRLCSAPATHTPMPWLGTRTIRIADSARLVPPA
jgi:hypothetical protein